MIGITNCLYELRAGFQSENFQRRYQELRAEASHQGSGGHAQMLDWTLTVHKRVLPKHGFEASGQGVQDMRGETGFHADGAGPRMGGRNDQVVAKLRRDIHMALDMDVNKNQRLPLFHTVGDSHSKFGWPPCVIQHHQGPLLCYNVDRVDLRNMHPPIARATPSAFASGRSTAAATCTST